MALTKKLSITGNSFIAYDGKMLSLGESSVQTGDLYIKVSRLEGDKQLIRFDVTYLDDGVVIMENKFSFKPEMVDKNFIEQAYLYLKTLPEFADAKDV